MVENSEKVLQWMFETKALRISPADKPFWYTSGTIGPYYINTHFLYGSEEKANELLSFIDDKKDDINSFPVELSKRLWQNYTSDAIYKQLVDEMCKFIKDNIDLDKVDYISGGERRDWFFSLLPAKLLNKPHLVIYKDLTVHEFFGDEVRKVNDIEGKSVLHIADLITEASSYERAWIPAVKNINGNIRWSVVVVDRKQGGRELLEKHGIDLYSMIEIGKDTFKKALEVGLINSEQYRVISDFIDDPKGSMRNFLLSHPEFLKNSLNAGGKEAERAKLCIEKNVYGIDMSKIE